MNDLQLQGEVVAVITETQGGFVQDWTGNTMTVANAADFSREGGQFTTDGGVTVYDFNSVLEGETDEAPDLVITTTPAPADWPVGDEVRVDIWPTAVDVVAEVAVDEDDTLPVVVPHALRAVLTDGVRDVGDQERVLIELRGSQWVVVDVIGRGAAIEMTTVTDLVPTLENLEASIAGASGVLHGVEEPANAPEGATWFKEDAGGNVIGVYVREAGQWVEKPLTGEALRAGSITAVQLAANSITGGKISANSITGDRIASKTITTEKLLVGTPGNMNPDPTFINPDVWGGDVFRELLPTGGHGAYSSSMHLSAGMEADPFRDWSGAQAAAGKTPVTEGSSYTLSAWVKPETDMPARDLILVAQAYPGVGRETERNYVGSGWLSSTTPAGTWVQITTTVTIPTGKSFAYLVLGLRSGGETAVSISDVSITPAGGGPNLFVDPGLTNHAIWGADTGSWAQSSGGRTTPTARKLAGWQTSLVGLDAMVQVTPGSQYRFTAWVKPDTDAPEYMLTLPAHAYNKNADGSWDTRNRVWCDPAYSTNTSMVPAGTWTKVTGLVQVPDGYYYMRPGVELDLHYRGTAVFSDFTIQPMTGGQLIVDGAIDGKTITGATVTGGLIQTSSAVSSGVKIDTSGIKGYDADGNLTLQLDGKANLMTGQIRTAPSGQPSVILLTTVTNQPGIWLSRTGTTGSSDPAIYLDASAPNLMIRGQNNGPIYTNGWRLPVFQHGRATVTTTKATAATLAVTFPKSFESAPRVFTNLSTGAGGTQKLVVRASSVTATGFSLYVTNGDATALTTMTLPVDWVAVL